MIARKVSKLEWSDRFTYKKSILFGAKELRSHGAKLQIVVFQPHTAMATHCHRKTVEVFHVLAGSGSLKLAGQSFDCKPNDIFLCEPGDWHSFLNHSDEDFVILNVKTNESEDDIVWEADAKGP